MGTTRIVDAVIAHSLTESHFQLSSYVGYSQLINVMKNDYQAHGQTLIHSYITDGNYRGVDAGINAALFLFDRSLQLKGGAGYHHQSLTGDYAAHNNIVSYNLDMMYYRGKFNAYALLPSDAEISLQQSGVRKDLSFLWYGSGVVGQRMEIGTWREKYLH